MEVKPLLVIQIMVNHDHKYRLTVQRINSRQCVAVLSGSTSLTTVCSETIDVGECGLLELCREALSAVTKKS